MPKGIKGFQKGHKSFYAGGSKKGHLVTEKTREKMKGNTRGFKKGNPKSKNAFSFSVGNKFGLGRKKPKNAHSFLVGKDNINWKGGVTPENVKARNSFELRLWRKSVFERDSFICQKCGVKSEKGKAIYLESHHIKNFSNFPELRTSIENGITFCKECHKLFHKEYGKKNNTKEQLINFYERNKLYSQKVCWNGSS